MSYAGFFLVEIYAFIASKQLLVHKVMYTHKHYKCFDTEQHDAAEITMHT